MTLSMSALDAVVKTRYPDGVPKNFLFQNHPLYAMAKEKKFRENVFQIPVQTALSGGRSHDFAEAQAGALNSEYQKFLVTPVTDYSYITFDGKTLRSLDNADAEQIVQAVDREFEGATGRLGNNVASEAYRSNTGSRCQVHPTTAISTTVLTLDYTSSARFFYKGARILGSATDGGQLRSDTVITLANVDYEAGTLVGGANWSTVSITNGDFLYIKGDTTSTAAGAGSSLTASAGAGAWVPLTVTSTSFFGVNRLTAGATQAVAGWRISTTGESMETTFIKVNAVAQTAGFAVPQIFVHPNDIARLEKAKEGMKVIEQGEQFKIGMKTFEAYGNTFIVDPDCTEGTAWAIDLKGGAFQHLVNGKQPAVEDKDGSKFSRLATADGYEARMVIDHNWGGFDPSKMIRIPLPIN